MDKNKKIKIAALTGGINTPSARFRIRQHIPALAEAGIIVTEHLPRFEKSGGLPSPFKAAARIPALFKSRDADIIWLNKELVQGYMTFEKLLKRPRILDADDAIWLNWPMGRWAAKKIAKAMDAVIAGNAYIADYFSDYCKNIHVVPTAVDLDKYKPKDISQNEQNFSIGWTGLGCNYKYLEAIKPALKTFLENHKDAELILLSDRPWKHKTLPQQQVKFIKWTKQNESSALHGFSVGIMPLADNKWTRGKCSFKMLQYMASAVPSIVSSVGMNKEILEKGSVAIDAQTTAQWLDAFEELYKDEGLRKRLAVEGRKIAELHFSSEKISVQLIKIFRQAAGYYTDGD